MAQVNLEQINLRAQEIQQNLGKIRKITELANQDILVEPHKVAALKYYLLEAIEAAASICNHLNAKILKKAPESYADCFENMAEGKIIDEALAKRLVQMANFRNLLIHHYYRIDDQKVLRYARDDIKDFEDFIEAVAEYVSKIK